MNFNEEIKQWLKAGSEIQAGNRLFLSVFPSKRAFASLALHRWDLCRGLMERLLAEAGGVSLAQKQPPRPRPMREQYPFLDRDDCPQVLKILATDKITCYRRCVEAHERLYGCATLEECYAAARTVIDNFSMNRKIRDELVYYRDNHALLGLHPIFSEMEEMDGLRRLSVAELFAVKKRYEHNLWRLDHRMKSGDKPHLIAAREEKAARYRRLLDEINRILQSYDRRSV